jgi:hypothetical protein
MTDSKFTLNGLVNHEGSPPPPSWLGPPMVINIPNPYKVPLKITPWLAVPCGVALLVFSVVTVYIILRHFRSLINLYLSVLMYLTAQLLLLAVIISSFVMELTRPPEVPPSCKVQLGAQTFSLLLPGYSILIVTLARFIFVKYPLSYFSYLKKTYHLLAFGFAVLICGLIAAAPSLGLCAATDRIVFVPKEDYQYDQVSYCSYGDKSEKDCRAFFGIVFTIGFIVPITSIISLYIYIFQLVKGARKSHQSLTQSSSQSSVKSNAKTNREQRSVPWSIIAILGVCITTTLPWAGAITYTVEITEMLAEGGNLSYLFDVIYSVLLILIGCSPMVYLFTTNSLRGKFFAIFKF